MMNMEECPLAYQITRDAAIGGASPKMETESRRCSPRWK